MSGLDKMKAQILEEAEQSAAKIIATAEGEAAELLESAKKEADLQAAEVSERAKRGAEEYKKRALSSMDMRRKQAVLAAKQEVISEVLADAYAQIMNLDEEKYFTMLEKMLEKYVLPEEGTIYFSQRDIERMPESFSGKIKTVAAARGGSLIVSDEARQIDGGFLLVYGGIEENCTIKAVFDSKKEELSDKVNRLLFMAIESAQKADSIV